MTKKQTHPGLAMPSPDWKNLYTIGGMAALIAGLFFRRNIAAEISLFVETRAPIAVSDWFELLQSNRLLGLAYLNLFDILNYALAGLMFLGLCAALWHLNKSAMALSAMLGFLGIAVYFASNTAFSMLSLSNQYTAASTETEKNILLAAGQAMLAINRFSNAGAQPGSGCYLSLLLIALAGMITSVIMLRSGLFSPATGVIGILANGLDLVYCLVFAFAPMLDSQLLAVIFIPAAGFFLMIWHIMTGWKLYRLGR